MKNEEKGRRERGSGSFVRPERYEEPIGGIPYLSSNSLNKNSNGVEIPKNDLPIERQEAILFDGPNGQKW